MRMMCAELGRRVALGILFLGLATLLGSCAGLPKDWPIKELTLPPGSSVAEMPHRINDLRTNLTQLPKVDRVISSSPKSKVAFNCEGGWDTVVSHVQAKLQPLGYTAWTPGENWQGGGTLAGLTGTTKLDDVVRVFISTTAHLTVVVLNVQNLATTAREGGNEEGAYVIEISDNNLTAPPS
jgi:hypothetical protein